jgi:hypothetical protein
VEIGVSIARTCGRANVTALHHWQGLFIADPVHRRHGAQAASVAQPPVTGR